MYKKTDYVTESKPVPVVLYVKQRKGAEFEGVTWYPTKENGLLLVAGRVGEKGAITLREEKVIHGEATAQRDGVVPWMEFTGRREGTTLKGTGEWKGPAFNGPVRVTFRLKLVE